MRPSRGHDLNSDIRLPVFDELGSYTVGMTAIGPTDTSHHLLCLPGILETAAGFHVLSDFAKNAFATYALDFSGRGLSDHLPIRSDYRMSRCLKEAFSAYNYLLGLIGRAENSKRHIHVVGNSMGGLIAIFLALNKPSYLRSIVINDVGCVLPWSGLMGLYGALGRSSFFPGRYGHRSDAGSLAQRLDVDTRLLSAVARPNYMDLPHQKTLFGISFEEQFAAIDIPIMVIRSSESQLLPEAVLQRMHSLPINVSYVDAPGSAHPVSYTESLVSTIYEFIADAEKKGLEKNHSHSSLLSLAKGATYERAFG
jgi:pimeloyl-ACP methyl ester carboxylesterase